MTKWLVRSLMTAGESVGVFGDFFRLTYVQNSGAAFSMFSGFRILLILLPLAAVIGFLWYLRRHPKEHWSLYLSGTLIIAGGIGNLIDRIIFGWVTDMLDFSIFSPVFNVADISVTAGCALLVFYALARERLSQKR